MVSYGRLALVVCLCAVVGTGSTQTLNTSYTFLTEKSQQMSLALEYRDCDHFTDQFNATGAVYYAVGPDGSYGPANGAKEINSACMTTLSYGKVLSAPRNSLVYNDTYAVTFSSNLFVDPADPYANSFNLSKAIVALSDVDHNLERVFEFSNLQVPPPVIRETLINAFRGFSNCTLFGEQSSHTNITFREPSIPVDITSWDEMMLACEFFLTGVSAIDQMYYNSEIPDAIGAEFADLNGGDEGYARGFGLYYFDDEGLMTDITIFGGLGATPPLVN